jgi:hypothetical protein
VTSSTSPKTAARFKKTLLFGTAIGSLASFDYFALDAEYLGAGLRFVRSLKIAVQISMDYHFGLQGLVVDSEEYDEVSNRFLFFCCIIFLLF